MQNLQITAPNGKTYSMPWTKPEDPSEAEIDAFIASQPVEETPVKKTLWEKANSPLWEGPSTFAKELSKKIDPEQGGGYNPRSIASAFVESVGDQLSGMTSPVNAALTALGPVGKVAGKFIPGAAKVATNVGRTAMGAMAGNAAYEGIKNQDPNQILPVVLGALGARGSRVPQMTDTVVPPKPPLAPVGPRKPIALLPERTGPRFYAGQAGVADAYRDYDMMSGNPNPMIGSGTETLADIGQVVRMPPQLVAEGANPMGRGMVPPEFTAVGAEPPVAAPVYPNAIEKTYEKVLGQGGRPLNQTELMNAEAVKKTVEKPKLQQIPGTTKVALINPSKERIELLRSQGYNVTDILPGGKIELELPTKVGEPGLITKPTFRGFEGGTEVTKPVKPPSDFKAPSFQGVKEAGAFTETNNPATLYHGTQSNFKDFENGKFSGDDYPAHYFTDSPEVASHYADGSLNPNVDAANVKGANVRKVKASLKKIFDIDTNKKEWDNLNDKFNDPADVVNELKKRGYDSFSYQDPGNELGVAHKVYGVFDGKQVNSSFSGLPHKVELFSGVKPQGKTSDKILNVLGIPKSLMSGFDLSATRQGFPLVGTPEYWKSLKPMIQAARSEEGYKKINSNIMSRENAQPSLKVGKGDKLKSRYEVAKVAITDVGTKLSKREEDMMSSAPEDMRNLFKDSKNPTLQKGAAPLRLVGEGYRASNRAHTAYLNELRSTRFDKLIELGKKNGDNVDSPEYLRAIGRFINHATGRGELGNFEMAAKEINAVMFSPKLMKSRLHFFNPMNYAQSNPRARLEMWKSAGSMAGALAIVNGLAAAAGAEVTLDPRATDFGKIKIGNTRIDMGGTFLPYIRLFARLATDTKISGSGKKLSLSNPKYGQSDTGDVLGDFARTKESPILSFLHDWKTGEDFKGDKFSLDTATVNRLTPMVAQDIRDVLKNDPELVLLTGPLSVFGAGIQSYKPKTSSRKPFTVKRVNRR